ncbi:hypothetical protein FSY59_00510 [Comamonas sp. Z3]|nr:hypothetical protein FSY59_00510 [Comamonas sp. Z3]
MAGQALPLGWGQVHGRGGRGGPGWSDRCGQAGGQRGDGEQDCRRGGRSRQVGHGRGDCRKDCGRGS